MDGVNRQGVGLMINQEAAKSILGWEGIINRMLVAHFMDKKCMISVPVVFMPLKNRLTEIAVIQMNFTYSHRSK